MKFSKLAIGTKFELWSGKYTKTGDFEYTSRSGDIKSIDMDVKTPYYAEGQIWVSEIDKAEVTIVSVGKEYIGYTIGDNKPLIREISSFYSIYSSKKTDSQYED